MSRLCSTLVLTLALGCAGAESTPSPTASPRASDATATPSQSPSPPTNPTWSPTPQEASLTPSPTPWASLRYQELDEGSCGQLGSLELDLHSRDGRFEADSDIIRFTTAHEDIQDLNSAIATLALNPDGGTLCQSAPSHRLELIGGAGKVGIAEWEAGPGVSREANDVQPIIDRIINKHVHGRLDKHYEMVFLMTSMGAAYNESTTVVDTRGPTIYVDSTLGSIEPTSMLDIEVEALTALLNEAAIWTIPPFCDLVGPQNGLLEQRLSIDGFYSGGVVWQNQCVEDVPPEIIPLTEYILALTGKYLALGQLEPQE